jgi:hypothetical protein
MKPRSAVMLREEESMKTMRWVLLLALSAGCGAQPSSSTSPEAPEAQTAQGGCDARTDCASCLATEGCNWTGGLCAAQCLMDTSCYGPGNPSASECPAPGSE